MKASLAALLATLLMSQSGIAEPLTADQIMQKVYDREDGDNAIMEMEMTLIDKQGQVRVRNVKSWRRDAGPDKKDHESLMFFISPADVKDTGFLTYDFDDPEKDDDQWLYLPALKKTKRIASSDKSSSFMGTDFTYADMTERNIKNYSYKLLKEEKVNDSNTWVIEATPVTEKEKSETGYTKSVLFVRQDNFVVIRGINWLEKGGKLKYMEIKKLELIDGVWTGTETTMTTKKEKETLHQTILKSKNVQFNQPQPEGFYSTRTLEQGT